MHTTIRRLRGQTRRHNTPPPTLPARTAGRQALAVTLHNVTTHTYRIVIYREIMPLLETQMTTILSKLRLQIIR